MDLQEYLKAPDETVLEKVRAKARELDKEFDLFITFSEPEPGKGRLKGVPVSVKDNICTKGVRTTAGSKILETYIPPFDATCIQMIKKEGAGLIGKTAMDEFGFGSFSTNCAYKTPKNPWDRSRACGGSSGGAGAAAAVLEPHIAIAESTGGSISAPAAFTGTVGVTPTYGLVSRYGLIDYANSLDKIGVIGKKVFDTALALSIIAGKDPKDATSVEKKGDYLGALEKEPKGMKIGMPKEYFSEGVDEKIAGKVKDAVKGYEEMGVEVVEVSLPSTKYSLSAYYIIAMSEASTNLAKYCGMRYGLQETPNGNFNEYFSEIRAKGFGKEAKRRIILGTYARMAGYRDKYYLKALEARAIVIKDLKKAFKECDALAAPTMPMIAPKFSEIEELTPLQNYTADILTAAPNLAGIPMLSMPCGFEEGMPVGMHLMADHFEEETLFTLARAYEKSARTTEKRPRT